MPAEASSPHTPDDLVAAVYAELRRLAGHYMAGEGHEHTLQPTALVHEAWLRVSRENDRRFQDSRHFLSVAAQTMRHILVDRARRRTAAKRGAGKIEWDALETAIAAPVEDESLLAVHEALERLAALDPRKAELVQLRYFAGLSFEEAAEVLGVSVPTANRWWAFSRAWLLAQLKEAGGINFSV